MKRITIVLDENLLSAIEAKFGERKFLNFSKIARELMKHAIAQENILTSDGVIVWK